jgi:hypothetical protein
MKSGWKAFNHFSFLRLALVADKLPRRVSLNRFY